MSMRAAFRQHLLDFLGFTPMAHRPPLPKRWWLYCALAFLAPSIVLNYVSSAEVPYRDLVWLVTLVPAYILSLHYGMHGAVSGLVMGTILFISVQWILATNVEPADWRVTVPIYVAYGAIAISVGWLSEQLHIFYQRAIQGERVIVIGQVAVAIRHEVNNALAAIIAEGQLLQHDARFAGAEDRQSIDNIIAMARRVEQSIAKLATVTHAPVTDYVMGVKMIDLTRLGRADS